MLSTIQGDSEYINPRAITRNLGYLHCNISWTPPVKLLDFKTAALNQLGYNDTVDDTNLTLPKSSDQLKTGMLFYPFRLFLWRIFLLCTTTIPSVKIHHSNRTKAVMLQMAHATAFQEYLCKCQKRLEWSSTWLWLLTSIPSNWSLKKSTQHTCLLPDTKFQGLRFRFYHLGLLRFNKY